MFEINDKVEEIIPGMAEQGKAVKRLYVESEYAPLKAAMVGNPSSIYVPDVNYLNLAQISDSSITGQERSKGIDE